MSDKPNDEERSFIFIEFDGIGSVDISYSEFNNVTAFQLLAMSGLMEFEGKNTLAMQRAAQIQSEMNKPKIAVPKPSIELGKK